MSLWYLFQTVGKPGLEPIHIMSIYAEINFMKILQVTEKLTFETVRLWTSFKFSMEPLILVPPVLGGDLGIFGKYPG